MNKFVFFLFSFVAFFVPKFSLAESEFDKVEQMVEQNYPLAYNRSLVSFRKCNQEDRKNFIVSISNNALSQRSQSPEYYEKLSQLSKFKEGTFGSSGYLYLNCFVRTIGISTYSGKLRKIEELYFLTAEGVLLRWN